MKPNYPIRNTVRILLFNNDMELLLMCIDDPKTRSINNEYKGKFWVTAGGKIEERETVKEAALRELFEETGIDKNEVKIGPIVWFRELDLILYGKLSYLKEQYIIAFTQKKNVSPVKLSSDEIGIIKTMRWFSLSQIKKIKEIVYPITLLKYLPSLIEKNYPKKPIKII